MKTVQSMLVLAAAAVLFGACAQQTEIVKLYDATDSIDGQYQRFLVIGIASGVDDRRNLEDLITGKLRAENVDAVAGHTETGPEVTLLQEDINAAARNTGSDAILITHIVSVDTTVDFEEGRVDILSECRGGDPAEYFLYDYEELKEPDSVRFAHTVVAVTNLYDTERGERVWTIQSTCFEKASMAEVLQEEADAIVRQLLIDNLIG